MKEDRDTRWGQSPRIMGRGHSSCGHAEKTGRKTQAEGGRRQTGREMEIHWKEQVQED